ncbi:unnamed protein product [Caenorhabditis sp. 36 PRJEB53466]|nr:unnamed protein product [Caenorhabditis sp. 36 PRJEB53466]
MFGYSERTNQWIVGVFSLNAFVLVYVYLFFHQEWISTICSILLPLLVWQILIFGVFAPDEVFMDLIGENHPTNQSSDRLQSPTAPSIRAVIVSSGDH